MSNADPDTLTARDLAAAFEWWRDAGVDHDFANDATDGLAVAEVPAEDAAPRPKPAAKPAVEEAPPAQKIDLLGANPPQDLAAFREWWLTEPTLDSIGPRGRVPPRGDVGAKLMLIVVDPEQGAARAHLAGCYHVQNIIIGISMMLNDI